MHQVSTHNRPKTHRISNKTPPKEEVIEFFSCGNLPRSFNDMIFSLKSSQLWVCLRLQPKKTWQQWWIPRLWTLQYRVFIYILPLLPSFFFGGGVIFISQYDNDPQVHHVSSIRMTKKWFMDQLTRLGWLEVAASFHGNAEPTCNL